MTPHQKSSSTNVVPWGIVQGGVSYKAEIVLAHKWDPKLDRGPQQKGADFRIVILTSPIRVPRTPIKNPKVGVVAPSQSVAEAAAAYTAKAAQPQSSTLASLLTTPPFRRAKLYLAAEAVIKDFAFSTDPEEGDALNQLVTVILFNSVKGYLQEMTDWPPSLSSSKDLHSTTTVLQSWLSSLREQLSTTRASIQRLSDSLQSPLGESDAEALDRLARLSSSPDAMALAKRVRKLYDSPSHLSAHLDTLRRLELLMSLGPEILSVNSYLAGLSLGRKDDELSVDLASIKGQLDLRELAGRPNLWASVQDMFQWFKSQYISLYIDHHASYHAELAQLFARANEIRLQVEGLKKLNSISELGPPVGSDLIPRYNSLLPNLQPCSSPQLSESILQAQPTCPQCHLALSQSPPVRQGNEILTQLREALHEQCRRLSRITSRKVLTDRRQERLERLIRVAQVSDLTSLVNVLDDELVQLLKEIFRESLP